MSDEDFLARWFRRKQKARLAPQPEAPDRAPGPTPPPDAVLDPSSPDVDLSKLPPIDEICAATDITAFLRKGIPQELSRAALRRAWSADPAIRDFVGLAENAWDFNDPDAMEGFGPLDWSAEQVEAFVRRVVGDVTQAAEPASPLSEPSIIDRSAHQAREFADETSSAESSAASRSTGETTRAELLLGPAAPQPAVARPVEDEPVDRRRTHGGALPH